MLVIDEKWLLLGPNRHGNTFAKQVVEQSFPGKTRMVSHHKHIPLSMVPPGDREQKIVVGIIRDPIMWYVSKWRRFWDDSPHKRYDFQTYFWRHCEDPHGPIGKNMESFPLSKAGIGAWSYKHLAYHTMDPGKAFAVESKEELRNTYYSLIDVDRMMCTEHLRRDLPSVFGDAVEKAAKTMPIPNPASHEHDAMQFCTNDIIEKIREMDSWLVSLYSEQLINAKVVL